MLDGTADAVDLLVEALIAEGPYLHSDATLRRLHR